MKELISGLTQNKTIEIKGNQYVVKTKTWYSIEEDGTTSYIKCELSNHKVLVIIPEDNLISLGEVIENMKYERIDENKIQYDNNIFEKTGEGHQFITKVEFGEEEEIEGKCVFEDYESNDNIISLGVLTDKNNIRADVYSEIIKIEDIKIK